MRKLMDILIDRHPAYRRGVRAAWVGGHWVLSPNKRLPRDEWVQAKINLDDLIPAGAKLCQDGECGVVSYKSNYLYVDGREVAGLHSGQIEALFNGDYGDLYINP